MELNATQTEWLKAKGLHLVKGHGPDFEIVPIYAPSPYSGKSYRYVSVYHYNAHNVAYTVNQTGLSHRFGMTDPIATEESSHPTLKAALKALLAAPLNYDERGRVPA